MGKDSQAAQPRRAQPSGVHISGGMRRAPGPAGPRMRMRRLEPSGRSEHARGVATPHHGQVAEVVGQAEPEHVGSLRHRESRMRHFAKEDHATVAGAAQGLKGDGLKRVTRIVMAPEVFMQLFLVLALVGSTGVSGGAMHVAASSRVDAGGIP
jgi:hypothetical protein